MPSLQCFRICRVSGVSANRSSRATSPSVQVSGQADKVQVSFASEGQSIGSVAGLTQAGAVKTLLAVLDARAEMDTAGDRLVLILPATIDA